MQESKYELAAKRVYCGNDLVDDSYHCVITDFGIAQIHHKSIARLHLDKSMLLSNLEYSVDAGAKILSSVLKFKTKEPKSWFCRYNAGTGSFKNIKKTCLSYKSKVEKYL